MNKAKLFLVATAPAALIMPIDAFAAEASPVKITGNNIEGATLTADTTLIPANQIASYQWYFDEGVDANGDALLKDTGITTSTFKVQTGVVDKALIVKVKMNDGTVHTSEKIVVNATMPIKGDNFVNSILYADIDGIKGQPGAADPNVFKSYQWYYFENDKKIPIEGATNIELRIPAEAAGKDVIVEAKSEAGKTYTSAVKTIDKLNLKVEKPAFEGYSPEKFVLPGDTLAIINPKVTDVIIPEPTAPSVPKERELIPSQISYAYQWMYEVDGSYSFIEGAMGATYTIPTDALEKKMNNIVVRVTVTVGKTVARPEYSTIVSVANTPADNLVKAIEGLLMKETNNNSIIYNASDLTSFGDKIKDLNSKYAALTAAAKANVTNYDILKRVTEDYKLMTSLKNKVDKAKALAANDPSKVQTFKALWEEYEQFDLLQRSMDMNIFKDIQEGLGNNNIFEITEVIAINKAILELLDDLTGTGSSNTLVQYKIKDIGSLQTAIVDIENRIAKLSNDYRMTVQNQDILKTAKSDIKKVQAFLAKVDKLDVTANAKKQKTAAKSVRAAYEKLNVKQQSLVPSELFVDSKLIQAEQAEEDGVVLIQQVIDQFITPGDTNSYSTIPSAEEIKEINKAITNYKTLTKESAKMIKGYAELLQLQKDIKTAEKVRTQLDNYQLLLETEGVSYSKKKSAYSSAEKAFKKLTSLQMSLVDNSHKLVSPPEPGQDLDDKPLTEEEEVAKAEGAAFKKDIEAALALATGDFDSYSQAIESVVLKYKSGLSSKARKYVTNYADLQAAEKDIKAVKSFLKKVDQAAMEGDAGKRYTKIQSVQTAFLKLPANQQVLAAPNETYRELIESLSSGDIYVDLNNFDDEIAKILSDDVSVTFIKDLESSYKKLSSAEKKKVRNYPILKQALADVKKVEAFEAKYNKMQGNTASSIDSIIKAFNELTVQQAKLVSPEIRDEIIELEKAQRETNNNALELVNKINGLVDSDGYYISGLQSAVNEYRMTYDSLSTAQRNLVKNYSRLTKAESDILKVADVRALEEVIETIDPGDEKDKSVVNWQKAYNKLSNQLENLYLAMYPIRLQ